MNNYTPLQLSTGLFDDSPLTDYEGSSAPSSPTSTAPSSPTNHHRPRHYTSKVSILHRNDRKGQRIRERRRRSFKEFPGFHFFRCSEWDLHSAMHCTNGFKGRNSNCSFTEVSTKLSPKEQLQVLQRLNYSKVIIKCF